MSGKNAELTKAFQRQLAVEFPIWGRSRRAHQLARRLDKTSNGVSLMGEYPARLLTSKAITGDIPELGEILVRTLADNLLGDAPGVMPQGGYDPGARIYHQDKDNRWQP